MPTYLLVFIILYGVWVDLVSLELNIQQPSETRISIVC